MTHSMTLRSNPRLLIFYSILALLPIGALALYPRFPPIAGGLILGASLFLDFKLFGFARPYLNTRIITAEDSITVFLAGSEEVFPWKEINLSGKCALRGKPFLFFYHLGKDRIITIPREYTDMRELEKTLEENTPFEAFAPGVDIQEVIYERFHAGKEKEAAPQD